MGTIYPIDDTHIRGGVEAVAFYLTQALAKADNIDLHIVSCNCHIKKDFEEKRGRVNFHWIATGKRLSNLRSLTLDAWRVQKVFKRLHPDIIHVQGISQYGVAARGFKNVVLAVHGIEWLVDSMKQTHHYSGLVGWYRRWTGLAITKRSLENANVIISNAGDYIPRLLINYIKHKMVYYIGNLVDPAFFNEPPISRIDDELPYLLWAGQINERKNLLELLAAFAIVVDRLPRINLVLIGPISNSEYYALLRKSMIALNLTEKVSFLGFVEQEMVLAIYKRAALFVMTSIEETAPMAIAQALAAGVPVIATRVGGIPWMVDEGKTGFLVESGAVQHMADLMIEIISDQAKHDEMALAAQQSAIEKFSQKQVLSSLINVYEQLLSETKT
jgi:glycosyltransferase involved in cell wall biosynthesis